MATAKKTKQGTWTISVYAGKKGGKKIYKRFTRRTKKEAERAASDYIAFNKNCYGEITFGEAAEMYIESRSNTTSPNTPRTYNTILGRLDEIAAVPVSKCDAVMIQRLVNRLSRKLAAKTVHDTYCFVASVLKTYGYPPTKKIKLPVDTVRKSKATRIPTDDEVRLMIDSAQHPDLALAIEMAAFGSMRAGECCALMIDMVFSDHVTVARTYVQNSEQKRVIDDRTKTPASCRNIPLPDDVLARIRASADEDGKIIKYNPGSLDKAFRRLTRRLDLYDYSFHSLRHYFATSLHRKNVPEKFIAAIGGWDNLATLQNIYTHATQQDVDEAAKVIYLHYKNIMGKSTTKKTTIKFM